MRRTLHPLLPLLLLAATWPPPPMTAADAPRTESATIWTARGELFMEYLPPVAGKPARFTAHLTELGNFRAVVRATVGLRLMKRSGAKAEGRVEGPARPGIFQPVVIVPEPGEYQGEVAVSGPDLTETFALESIRVLKDDEPAPPTAVEAAPGGDVVPFLKEQQWKIPFRSVIAERRTLVHSIRVLGEVTHKPGLTAEVTSPVEGRVASAPPEFGQRVKAGEFLLEIAPFLAADVDRPHLDQELIQSTAEEAKARADVERIGGLVGQGLMPAKELEAARTQLTIAISKIASARQHRQTYLAAQQTESNLTVQAQHFQVRAPISGEIAAIHVTRDQLVTRDRPLLKIDDLSRMWVELKVFEPDLAEAREATGAVFKFLGESRPLTLEELSGKLVHVSHQVDAGSRTASVIFDTANPGERIPFGAFVEADLRTRRSGSYVAVPHDAVMDDSGKSIVYVHASGEEFEKREVVTGVADRGWVAITSGVKEGDRVVTTGAYQIRLSTLSGAIPEHGHTH